MKQKFIMLVLFFSLVGIAVAVSGKPPAAGDSKTDAGKSSKKLPAIEADVRKVRWGMTQDQVKEREKPSALKTATRQQLEYRDTIFSQEVRVLYSFSRTRLIAVDIIFSPGTGRETALHKALLKTLSDKYGKPKGAMQGRYGTSLYTRDEWALARMNIRIESVSGGVKITYSSRGLAADAPVYSPGKDDRDKL